MNTEIERSHGFLSTLTITPGLTYQFNKTWQLTLSLPSVVHIDYRKTKYDEHTNYLKTSEFMMATSLSDGVLGSLGIGFAITF
jgi:hypothetical protein